MASGTRGVPGSGRPGDEELFMNQSKPENDIPTVGPLRISKQPGGTPSPGPAASPATGGIPPQAYPPPTSKPLPYPDDGRRPQGAALRPGGASAADNRTATPDDGRRTDSPTGGSGGGRARFSANDPNRPSLAGYGQNSGHGTTSAGGPAAGGPNPNPQDGDGLFQKPPVAAGQRKASDASSAAAGTPLPNFQQQYWPPPVPTATETGTGSSSARPPGALRIPTGSGISRLDSTASVSTTRAQRGSPPPPETPIADLPSGGIEARYAAAGIGGPPTLSSAAQQRQAQYPVPQTRAGASPSPQPAAPQSQQSTQPPRRPWTPTEQPGTQPYGAPVAYQGTTTLANYQSPASATTPAAAAQYPVPPASATAAAAGYAVGSRPEHPVEHDMGRLNLNEEPPPAYSSITSPAGPAGYPNEKARPMAGIAQPTPSAVPGAQLPNQQPQQQQQPQHPAFANDPRMQNQQPSTSPAQGGAPQSGTQMNASPVPAAGPASPPPLPEGWIAHLDPNSGHYYYIHLPTQSTQWEFPKGPTPLNLNEPLSPTGTFVNPLASPVTSTFNKPLASPSIMSQSVNYRPETALSMASAMHSPTAVGFTGPPPSAGVDIYKVAPTNGVYFGPYLRYVNMDIERGLWLGTIMLVTDAPQPPTIHIHQSVDLSPDPRQLKPHPIYSHQRWIFFRYDVDLKMEEEGTKWTYAVTSHLGCTRYEFIVAGRYETSWRFIAHSGNDFSLGVNANERSKLGGVGFMWKDILQKHIECNGFHAQLGLGGQINADRMWKEIPLLKQWTATSGKENRKNAPWTQRHEEDVTHAYFHYYTSHFDQPHLREAFAQIPHVLILDDHDIFDGYGSYPEYMQFSNMFKNIGRVGTEMYLLFQHHTTLDILRAAADDTDLFSITGTGWHFLKYLGPAVVVVGADCRSERNPHQVMAGKTYQGLFPKVAVLPPSVQHCIWMIPVPIVYPRLESMEHLISTVSTGKKAVTGGFNMLGKVAGGVAGIVGAKGAVNEGFSAVKKAVGKSGLMSGVISPFGDIDLLDELRDQWTHESKDLERTYLIRTLQGIAHNKSLRMTFLSGAVGSCGAGLVHDPSHPQDHKTMYQLISSSVVNAPPASYIMRLLHNNKPLYVPQNGHRTTNAPSDTKEDMMEIFAQDVTGAPREHKRLMPRRNYLACVAFDPDVVSGAFGQHSPGGSAGPGADGKFGGSSPSGQNKLSLACDFMVQGEGVYAGPVKYGPVIIPSLDFGQ